MNPYEHSDVAVAVYICIEKANAVVSQEAAGDLACSIADMLAKNFDLEPLAPPPEPK